MRYSFYYPPENKVLVARNAEFLENSLINQEASGSIEDLEIIQEEDFGPTPFKFYNSWLLDKNLHSIIADFWGNFAQSNCSNPIILFKNKMKALKIVIKE
nr:cytochrome P450 [Tanacetum cinerariifolium]